MLYVKLGYDGHAVRATTEPQPNLSFRTAYQTRIKPLEPTKDDL